MTQYPSPSTADDPSETDAAHDARPSGEFAHEQDGYRTSLKPRQLQMIALGGAIGTGLFLGAGGRLHAAGPSLFLVYAFCGFFAFLILRALGELVMHRPASGSFTSYAREFFGEKLAFVAGWMYSLFWAMASIGEVTAIAIYLRFWPMFASVPQWVLALAALIVVLALNLVSVKVFGAMEFWFSCIKIVALIVFLVIGSVFLALSLPTDAGPTGVTVWAQNGGVFPTGALAGVLVVQGVVFAYAGIELVGTAAGEAKDARRIIPRAVNSVVARIVVFYVGSVLVLSLLLPFTMYSDDASPFVTFFEHVGDPRIAVVAANVMNFVVLTAALSSLNAGLYSTGRILRSMSIAGSAPRFAGRMNAAGVPYGGILLVACVTLLGVGLNAVVPGQAFDIVLHITALGVVSTWATIVVCQLRLRSWAKTGRAERPTFRLFGSPFTSWLTLAFLAAVLVLMAFDYPIGTMTIGSVVVIAPLLALGWFACRRQVRAYAAERAAVSASAPEGTDGTA